MKWLSKKRPAHQYLSRLWGWPIPQAKMVDISTSILTMWKIIPHLVYPPPPPSIQCPPKKHIFGPKYTLECTIWSLRFQNFERKHAPTPLQHRSMSLSLRWAYAVVCPQFTRNASPPSILIRFEFFWLCLKELVPVHETTSQISEILINN